MSFASSSSEDRKEILLARSYGASDASSDSQPSYDLFSLSSNLQSSLNSCVPSVVAPTTPAPAPVQEEAPKAGDVRVLNGYY